MTLLQAIEAEIVPVPEPVTKKKDGISITTAEEVKLWRQAMDFFHDIKSDDEDDDADEK